MLKVGALNYTNRIDLTLQKDFAFSSVRVKRCLITPLIIGTRIKEDLRFHKTRFCRFYALKSPAALVILFTLIGLAGRGHCVSVGAHQQLVEAVVA